MKKHVFLLAFIGFSVATIAQEPPRRPFMEKRMQERGGPENKKENQEKIELFKIQYITKELNLTPAEATQFWPVYEAQKKAIQEILLNKGEDEIQLEEALLLVRKKYKNDLKPIFKSEERVNDALKVDREFMKKVRFEMMRRKGKPS
jgi:Spy/CpxP family protein refolding chaperone